MRREVKFESRNTFWLHSDGSKIGSENEEVHLNMYWENTQLKALVTLEF